MPSTHASFRKLGGRHGELTVAMQYGFQSWNSHLPGKYRDLLYGIAAEEMGHVEMPAIMIPQLLGKHPTPDGKGEFSYHEGSTTTAPVPDVTRRDADWPAAAREKAR